MKTIKILFICMLATLFVTAQNVPPFALEEVEVVPPKFTSQKISLANGEESIKTFIAQNFVYPEGNRLQEGTEVVQFTINTNGKLSNFKVVNSVSLAIDKEIISILENTDHMWIPGKNNGIPVNMEKEIAVQVKVGYSKSNANDRDFTSIARGYFTKGATKLFVHQKAKKALNQFEEAMRYRPYDQGILLMLALCEMELGHTESATAYVDRIKEIDENEVKSDLLTESIRNTDAYKELEQLLATR